VADPIAPVTELSAPVADPIAPVTELSAPVAAPAIPLAAFAIAAAFSSAIFVKFCGTLAAKDLSVGELTIDENAAPVTPLIISSDGRFGIPGNDRLGKDGIPGNDGKFGIPGNDRLGKLGRLGNDPTLATIELTPPVTSDDTFAAKLPEEVTPDTLPINEFSVGIGISVS
jgi:hypothetical protein